MENIEETLNQDDVLSSVHQYELERDEERVLSMSENLQAVRLKAPSLRSPA